MTSLAVLLTRLGFAVFDLDDVARASVDVDEAAMGPRCRVCGCTNDLACPGGCWWVADPQELGDLCSSCIDPGGIQEGAPRDEPS